jgi:D-alanyl-D-alanine endopeptidase (penicillin-binding protein 7)
MAIVNSSGKVAVVTVAPVFLLGDPAIAVTCAERVICRVSLSSARTIYTVLSGVFFNPVLLGLRGFTGFRLSFTAIKLVEKTVLRLYFTKDFKIFQGEARMRWLIMILVALLATSPALSEPQERTARKVKSAVASRTGVPALKSSSALVVDQSGRALFAKNIDHVVPIASITKLMTAMVVIDADLPLTERIVISEDDKDLLKGTRSRLRIGTVLTRRELLHLALMASENRAAEALSRVYPGGTKAFVAAMNQKAVELGMWRTRFVDGTGLSSDNVSTAQDLTKMVGAAYHYPLIREFTTDTRTTVEMGNGRTMTYNNSNRLVSNHEWQIGLSKTGYISEAGRCLVMQAKIAGKPVIIVLLDSWGKMTRIGDANRLKRWMETRYPADTSG